MIQAIDHVVILVNNLAAAVADYERLGFRVTAGGEHTGGATHNALISFADGSYLELIAFRRAAPEHRWWRHSAAGEGLIDFALLPGAIGEDVAAAQVRGLAIHDPQPGGRERPDGVRLEWQTAAADSAELPFLCGDVTARELRVPAGEAWQHGNGVQGIGRVGVAVRDLEGAATRYAALLGQTPSVEAGRQRFKLGSSSIELLAPAPALPEREELEAQLATRGEGIFVLALQRDKSADAVRTLAPELTHGARLTLE